jgi:23S rRNA (uridine2552-2'-O)-methyltransferase
MCRSVVQFAKAVAVPSCSLVLKVIQGVEFQKFIQEQRKQFRSVLLMKPKASRKQSSEVYCILRQFL